MKVLGQDVYFGNNFELVFQEKQLPDWYLIFKNGKTDLAGGTTYYVDEESWNSVLSGIKQRGVDIVFDYGHASLYDEVAPAAGWCTAWRWTEEGIEARVEWTEDAAEMLNSRKIRYFSPAFYLKDIGGEKKLVGVVSVALTNLPKTSQIKPMVAGIITKEGNGNMELLQRLIEMLGLAPDASEDDVVNEMQALLQKLQQPEEASGVVTPEMQQQLEAARELKVEAASIIGELGLPKNSKLSLALAKIKAMQSGGSETDKLKLQVASMQQEIGRFRAKALLEKYASKLSPDALKQKDKNGLPFWENFASMDPDGFEIVAASMPDFLPQPLPQVGVKPNIPELSEESLAIAKSMGNSVDDLKKYNNKVGV